MKHKELMRQDTEQIDGFTAHVPLLLDRIRSLEQDSIAVSNRNLALIQRNLDLEAEVKALRSAGYSCPTCDNDAVDSVAETSSVTSFDVKDANKDLKSASDEDVARWTYLNTRDCEHAWTAATNTPGWERCRKCFAGRAVETKGEQT